MTSEGAEKYTRAKSKAMVMRRIETALHGAKESDGSDIASVANADYTRRGASVHYGTDPGEIRSGKMNSDMQVSGAVGAAIGMCSHLASGVFTGTDDLSGATQIAWLYVSGDGIHATAAGGAAYPCGVGFTSCFTSLEGDHVGTAAAEYAAGVPAGDFTAEEAREKEEILTAPYRVKEGVDPNWAVDVLHGIMSPYWVLAAKSGPMLQAALLQVEYMRENVVPKLMAKSGHDLRIAIEARNKILSAELKLRASLERKESRGNSYRTDYPYRDDENYLKYILAVKGRDGKPVYSKVPVNEAWTGDRQEPYEKRFSWLFPGEAKALGLTVEERR